MIIRAEYKGATNSRGAHLYVTSTGGKPARIPYDYGARSTSDLFANAAKEYAKANGLPRGEWVGAADVDGSSYVFVLRGRSASFKV